MADVGGAILGGTSLLGALLGSKGSKDAAKEQAGAANQASALQAQAEREAIAEQRRQFDLTRQDLSPWMKQGTQALSELGSLLGIGPSPVDVNTARNQLANLEAYTPAQVKAWGAKYFPQQNAVTAWNNYKTKLRGDISAGQRGDDYGSLMDDFNAQDFLANKDPGYQFRMDEGLKAINAMAANRGSLDSGATLKALNEYGQDYASNEYQNAWNRDAANKQSKFNMLSGVSGTGQNTATSLGGFGANTAGNIGNIRTNTAQSIAENYLGAGNARAAGTVGAANAWGNALNNIGSYYQLQRLLRS